ncbi:MAG: outer membrane protein assembly factor BamB family protein [Planctomycetota bacterium]|jgi:outer membrane protein assembly factor BamB/protein-L-isoaspartate O-methyltransferase
MCARELGLAGTVIGLICLVFGAVAVADEPAVAGDSKTESAKTVGNWPQWRGPNRDNVSGDTDLLKEWPTNGPPLLWRVEGLGEGIASVSIAGGRVFTLGYRDELEYVTAVSAETGEQLWMTPIGPAVAESRLMRWLGQRTPTVDGERLYAVRSDGGLVCLHVEDGCELWRKSYAKDFGTKRPAWGICDYPLVDGDKLICSPGGSEATIVALNKENGEVIWKTSVGDKEPSSYVATVVTEGGGIRQYVTFLRKGLVSVAASDGRLLWRYEKLTAIANSVTPIVRGDSILSYNGYGSGRALLKLVADGDDVKLQEEYVHSGYLDPFQDSTLWVGDYVHTFRQRGILDRYDARTGESMTLAKRIGGGISSMTFADGHLFLRNSEGLVSLIEATGDDYVEKSRFTIPDHERAMGATNPVVTGGRLWLRDDNHLFCYDVRRDALDRPTLAALITLRPAESKHTTNQPTRSPRSVFVPTPRDVVEKMLELAAVKTSHVVYDLGSGDGRIVMTAAKRYGCQAVGYEIDRELVQLSSENAKKAGVEPLVKFENTDIFTVDLSGADVIAVYLLPKQLEKLIPQLEKLKPGSRIVSHQFDMPGVKPDKVIVVDSEEDGDKHTLYLWTTPLKMAGGKGQ